MIRIGKKLYADAGHYLKTEGGMCKFSFLYSDKVKYEELPIQEPVIKEGQGLYKFGPFHVKFTNNMKKTLVNKIFSNDDQIAIMLNKDNSDDDLKIYNLMQDWREYFSKLIKEMEAL